MSSWPPVHVWSTDRHHTIAQWRNVLFTVWRQEITVAALEASRVASHDLARSHAGGLLVFNVVREGLPIPGGEVRRKASSVLGETSGHVRCTATVIEGEGFWTSAARAIVASITLLSRAAHPHRVFATIDEAATWAMKHVVGEPAASELASVAASLREAGSGAAHG
ncbi:MAG: hypothetical protein K1X88_19750 [Nannocystaceae bacterium]|nr:hypothetical protein [Nannocystaceae bacterium]